ncbi:MAG: ATPase, T2SS/T4P/T4SS family [Acidimicrobiales bacterium]
MARGRRNKVHAGDVGEDEAAAPDGLTQPSTSLPVDIIGGDEASNGSTGEELPDAPEPASTWNVDEGAPTWPTEGESVQDSGDTEAGLSEPSPEGDGDTQADDSVDEPTTESLPVKRDSHPEAFEDNDDLLPVPLESPQLAPHLRELKIRAQDALIERMGARLYDRTLTEDQIESYVMTELGGWLFEEDARISDTEREQLTAELLNDVLRHGPIEPFLDDDGVSEIMVNGLATIYVERSGKLTRTTSQFLTEAHLRQVIERIVSKVGRRIDESSPMVDARLPDGSRVNAVIPPLAVDGPSLTIRKFSKEALRVQDLIGFGTLSPSSVAFLEACVRGRMNVLVSGGTGTGKTTLLNVLSHFIPEEERIVTLEDAVELQLRQEHLVRLESRPPNVEGKGQITIRDLVRNSLRMRPDRVIIGECRGGEALDMLQAMNTGHDGSLSTLHANGPRDALARLETLCLMAGMDLPVRAIREQIASAVDLLVHVARLRDGTRRVTHVSEVVGMEEDSVMLSDIYTFDFDAGLDIDGRYSGQLHPTGLTPVLVTKLHEQGEEVDMALFDPEAEMAGGVK